MTNTLIIDCWNVIQQKDKALLTAGYQPLSFIDDYLSYFDLPLLLGLNIKSEALTDISYVDPSFKALTDDIIFSLRHHIYTQTKLDIVDKWAEKLMRFCEIRYFTLKKRSINKCKTTVLAQLHILHLVCFFMDQSFCSKDLRFFNIALKLADLKWVFNRRTILCALIEMNNGFDSALLHFRIILTIEYAINQQQEGGKND